MHLDFNGPEIQLDRCSRLSAVRGTCQYDSDVDILPALRAEGMITSLPGI